MATAADAQLILKLYELRTEAGMRTARKFVQQLSVSSFDELLALQRDMSSQENAYWRQVLSYWEMAAAMVLRDALDPDLFCDSNGEPFFLYAKFTPYLEQWLAATGQPFMRQTAKMIAMYPEMQQRYTMMLAMMEARRKQAAV